MTYLHVQLKGGERWIYDAPHTHDIAWLATNRGHLSVAGATLERELAVFEEGREPIEVTAVDDAEFVIGSARRHPHPLIKGASSVHTSAESLRQGEQTINAIRQSGAYSSLIARKP